MNVRKLTSSPAFRRGIFGGSKPPSNSRFNKEPMPFLHEHRRRVPTQDIDRSIDIGVGCVAATLTGKSRLALARLAVYGSTFRAGLRRVVRRRLAKVSTPLFQFVIEQSFKDMPTLIENRPVETGLLTHSASGFAQRAFGAGGHVPGVQVFDHNRAKPLGQVKANSVTPVLTNAGAPGAQGGDAAPGFGVPR